MLYRKIESELERFYENDGKEALLIDGARQVGKTTIIRAFAQKHFDHFIEINFIKTPQAQALFQDLQDEKEFQVRLSAFVKRPLLSAKTLIFFDEVQRCPEVVTYIKFLVEAGHYYYILSGSLLGVELKNLRSAPVGYLREITMYPLDFEEFCLANGITHDVFGQMKKSFTNQTAVDEIIHTTIMKLFKLYLVVGGMPAAVQMYLDTHDIQEVIRIQQSIIIEYKRDIAQYDPSLKMRLTEILELIPAELNKKNKRFYVGDMKNGDRFDRMSNSFIWLKEAGVALPSHSVEEPKIPLLLSKTSNLFKLFLNDVGLLASMYMDGIQLKLLTGELEINFGAIYENFAAQELKAHGIEPYYFNSKKQGEVDFMVEYNGSVLPLEIKSGKDYKRHSALTNLLGNSDYSIPQAWVMTNDNVSTDGKIIYYPIYFLMFLHRNTMPEKMIYDVDLSALKH